MAAGTYTTDLQIINLAETNTGWVDINQAGGGGANTAEPDFAIQGNNAISRQVSNTRRGVLYNNGSTITLGTDEHIYTWTVCSTPGIVDNKSLGGIRVSVGTGTTAYYDYYVNGGDTLPEGGMNNYVVYYAAASASATVGSPGANPQYFGAQASTNATARNINFACDAIYRGTGYYLTDGDSTDPIVFVSASQDNDLDSNRYGVFTAIPGGYNLKGRFVIGQNSTGTPTQAYFRDANTSVVFADTEFAKGDFTQIIIDHPSTFANFRNITFTGLGTQNPGQFNFKDSSTVGYLDGCTFNNIGTTQLQAAVTASSTWIGCNTVNQSGSLINSSIFNNTSAPTSAVVSDRPDRITNSTFISTGTKHGLEVIAAGSYVFQGNTLTGFDSGSNANEFLYFNPTGGTGDLTLTVVDGSGTIEYRNASSGTVTIVNSVSITLTGLKDNTEVRVFDSVDIFPQTELAGVENATDGTPGDRSFTFSLEVGTIVDIVIQNVQYKYIRIDDFELTETENLPITQIFDRNYSNPGEEEVFLSDPFFTSLASRATFYENETESKTFVRFLESENLWASASYIYTPTGYSSGTIHSLVPSSSAGDVLLQARNNAFAPDISSATVGIPRSDGYITTASADNIPLLAYSPESIGASGSFIQMHPSSLDADNPINFPNVPAGDIFTTSNDLTVSANATLTQPVSGIVSPDGSENAVQLIDNNVGGNQIVSFAYPSVAQSTSQRYLFRLFAKYSGAQYLYVSASGFGAGNEGSQWFDLINGATGSTGGTLVNGVTITNHPNDWKSYNISLNINTVTGGTWTVGISDTDGGNTVSSDGTANVYLWGLNTLRFNSPSVADISPIQIGSPSAGNTQTISARFTGSLSVDATNFSWFVECSPLPMEYITGSSQVSSTILGIFNSADPSNDKINVSVSSETATGTDSVTVTGQLDGTFFYNPSVRENAYGLELLPFANNKLVRIAGRAKSGDSTFFINGTEVVSSANTYSGTLDQISLFGPGDFNIGGAGKLKRAVIFNTGLTNTQLALLTNSGSYS